VGRFSAEKRWNMVMRAVGEVGRKRSVGMLLVGDGSKRIGLELLADRTRNLAVLSRISDREELARLIACADALVHGCEAETFCLVAAEARASGVPLIVPDRGATVDQLVSGAGTVFRAGSQISLERAINRFIDRGPELQRAAAVRASHVRTMDEHFAELFARYLALVPQRALQSGALSEIAVGDVAPAAALGS
jgi:alpha-1,6-mannosyltransferase